MSMISIQDLNLSVTTGKVEKHILRDVSFNLDAGKITGVAGASGSGKTQTGLAIMGLSPAGAQLRGSIDFDGTELVGMPAKVHNRLRGVHCRWCSKIRHRRFIPCSPSAIR